MRCPPGADNAAGDDPARADTQCDAIVCAEDEFVQSNACVACASGSENLAGDDATGPDTTCDGIRCASNQFVSSNACTPCSAGTTNDAGDDASGDDTRCTAITCSADEFVSSNACTPCPAGSTNDAGDDASGDDTRCDPTLCAADQRVEQNVCVLCAEGETNAEGDDASGEDTQCDDACARTVGVRCDVFDEGRLKVENPQLDERFGFSVAIDGDTLVVGAYLEDSNATGVDGDEDNTDAPDAGAVYVFRRGDDGWVQEAYLKASNAEAGDWFGYDVAIDGDLLVASARDEKSGATGVDGDQTDNGADFAGAAYVFRRVGGTWSQEAYLKASNTAVGDIFGHAVAVSGETVVVSANFEDSAATGVDGDQTDNGAGNAGAVYVFSNEAGVWSQEAYLKASNTEGGDRFGSSLALVGDTLVVGAREEDGDVSGGADNSISESGAVYIFDRGVEGWAETAYLKSDAPTAGALFGWSVAYDGVRIAVGAPEADSIDGAADTGAAYVFAMSAGVWTLEDVVSASNAGNRDRFGTSVAIDGERLLVGAPDEASGGLGVEGDPSDDGARAAGAAYLFALGATRWTELAYIKAEDTRFDAEFGHDVAQSGPFSILASPRHGRFAGNLSGAVYVRRVLP